MPYFFQPSACISRAFIISLVLFVLVACGAPALPPSGTLPPNAGVSQGNASATSPQTVQHIVLIKLTDKNDRTALEQDCNAKLSTIPGVVEFSIARPVDTGRTNVDGDYDVAVVVGFSSIEGYKAFLAHPDHVALGKAWKEKFQTMRIYDFGN